MSIYRKFIGLLVVTAVLAFVSNGAEAASFIIEDGKANAEIIISEKPTRTQKYAAEELRDIIKKISGAELSITAKATDELPVKVYIGKSDFTDSLKLKADELKFGAYKIVSGDNYLVLFGDDSNFTPKEPWAHSSGDRKRVQKEWDELTGARWQCPNLSTFKAYNKSFKLWMGDGKGSLNAVYDFLRSLGARWYFPGELGECLPELKSIELTDTNKTVHPDFEVRNLSGGGYVFGRGSKLMVEWSMRMGWRPGGGGTHGIDRALHHPYNRENHPEWFMLKDGKRVTKARGGMPCLSSKELFQSNIEYIRTIFKLKPNVNVISVMPTDGYTNLCQCDLCKDKGTRERGYNGFLSDYVWGYVNDVAKEIYTSNPDKKIVCGAYTSYQYPPLKIDKMSPNVMVRLAQARRTNVKDDQKQAWLKLRELWKPKLSGKKPFLTHDNFSPSADSPFPMFYTRIIAEDIKSLNGISMGDMIEANSVRANDKYPYLGLAVNHLNMYVTSRLWWDADQSLDALLNEYYEKFYGPAAKEMKALIEFCEANWFKMKKDVKLVDKTFELIEAAKKAVDKDSIYGKRVALVDSYIDRLRKIREKIAVGRAKNPVAIINKADDKEIKLDGVLDEDIWQQGKAYWLSENKTGNEATYKTWFRSAWKNGNLYFAVHCQEPDMKNLKILTEKNEDPAIWSGDTVEIFLETQNHAFYQITVNPAEAITDVDWKTKFVTKWDSKAEFAVHKGKDFWNVEIMFPIAPATQEVALPFEKVAGGKPTKEDPWYFNIGRTRRHESGNEASIFSTLGKRRFRNTDQFGILYME